MTLFKKSNGFAMSGEARLVWTSRAWGSCMLLQKKSNGFAVADDARQFWTFGVLGLRSVPVRRAKSVQLYQQQWVRDDR